MMGELLRRLQMLFGRRKWRAELDEEMRLHRELRGDERKFGNALRWRERSQEQWGWRWLDEFLQDVRHGLRLLARTPLITALALASLALGIGANTALFSLADAALFRPLPVAHPEQLLQVYTRSTSSGRPSPGFTNPMWEQVRGHQEVFSGTFAWSVRQFSLNTGGEQKQVWGDWASGGYFTTLGIHAERGRLFSTHDDYPGCPAIADISDAFWHSHFGGSPLALGAPLTLDGRSFTVIGIMPSGFWGPDVGTRADVVAPLCAERKWLRVRDAWWLAVMGRLKPGVAESAAQARLQAQAPAWMAATVPEDYSAVNAQQYRARRWTLEPGGLGMSWVGQQYGAALEILLGIAGLVLLLACANLSGLMLARTAARREELAVRAALGAGRGRLVRQLLTESLLLAMGGAALGIALAAWACGAAQTFLAARLDLTPDLRVLGFAAGLTMLTALLVGLAPALGGTRGSLAARAQPAQRRTGRSAAALQVAIAVLLLAGAGLFLRSFANLNRTPLGFEPGHVALVTVSASKGQAPFDSVMTALRALPGVSSASASFLVPAQDMQWDTPVQTHAGQIPDSFLNAVSPGYFQTVRTPLLAGRDFNPRDTATSARVAIVSQSLARSLFGAQSPLGQYVRQGGLGLQPGPWFQVIGVAADAKFLSVRDPAPPMVYFALAQRPGVFGNIIFELRSPLRQATLAAEVRAAMARSAPSASYQLGSMNGLLATLLLPESMLAWLSAWFGGLALLLTGIGLYGLAAYGAERRRREFGIRMALGAESGSIARLALGELAWTLSLGVAAGAMASWLGARAARAALGKLLYELRPTDVATLAAAAAVLLAVTLAAAYLPAHRAAHADPLASLREE